MNQELLRYELSVNGMTCVKCAQRIEEVLLKSSPPASNIHINIISNRVIFSIPSTESIKHYIARIEKEEYTVVNTQDITQSNDETKRILRLRIKFGDGELIEKLLDAQLMAKHCEIEMLNDLVSITYKPLFIRGTEIMKIIEAAPAVKSKQVIYSIENPFEENQEINLSSYTGCQVIICLLCLVFLVVTSVLPDSVRSYPKEWGIGSIYIIITIILTFVIMFAVGFEIFKICFKQMLKCYINMITLISIGSGFAFIFGMSFFVLGLIETITGDYSDIGDDIMNTAEHLQTSAAIFTSVVTGKYLQARIKKRVHEKINELKSSMKVRLDTVTRIIPENKEIDVLKTERIHPALIEKDDLVLIERGMLPFDGFIEKGSIKIMENAQFGWEAIEARSKGQRIVSGSQVLAIEEQAVLRVSQAIEHTVAGKLFFEIKERMNGSTLDEKTNTTLSKFTKYFIIVILLISAFTLVFWLFAKRYSFVTFEVPVVYPFERAIAVLVASCPCALGSAIPMVFAIALRKALKNGLLIKESSAIEELLNIDTVVFDKTGTITGTYNLRKAEFVRKTEYSEAAIWTLISLLEKDHLEHPVGLLIYQESLKHLSQLGEPSEEIFKDGSAPKGQYLGSEGIVDEGVIIKNQKKRVAIGNKKLLERFGISQDSDIQSLDEDKKENELILWVVIDDQAVYKLVLDLKESLKPNVTNLIEGLHKRKIQVHLLTGDNKINALDTAITIGIKPANVKAEVTPSEKEDYIRLLVKKGHKVMMVGDGINDIKAFQEATLSCTINFKSSQNLSSSSFVIIDNDVENILGLFRLAAATQFLKILIVVLSLLYNVPVTLAASGLTRVLFGFDLPAFMAAWTMFLSSVLLTLMANCLDFVSLKKKKKIEKSKFKGVGEDYVRLTF